MEIQRINVLRGPNYWSDHRKKLIALRLDLQKYEYLPTDLLPGFTEKLAALMPSLYEHRCSRGAEGGFLKRLEEGTWLGHVIEHVALELQWLSGMPCGFGRTRPTSEEGVYHVVFAYEIENAGIYAGKAAVRIVEALAKQEPYHNLAEDIQTLKTIHENERLGPSTESIVKEAESRGIPVQRLDHESLIMLGLGCNQRLICSTLSSHTSNIGVDIVYDKDKTKKMLAAAFIPVPAGIVITSAEEIESAMDQLAFPWVIKPQDGNHGKGITTDIQTKEKAIFGFHFAKKFSENIIIEQFIKGYDFRFLVINYKVVAVAQRQPASIVGTGELSIQALIDEANSHPDRGVGHQNFLTKITVDEITQSILCEKGLTLDTILPKNEILYLKNAANISSGGTAVDVTDYVHSKNIQLAERAARLVHLDICGIDIVAPDITTPIKGNNGAVIEVNAGPGFRMHLSPTLGAKRNVAKHVIDMLYPNRAPARIPIVAVTGTNGKTTLVRLIAHFAKSAGRSVGFTTTEGIYINDQQIETGDCSGPSSASIVLRDPIVNYAVLECARGGILRSGLGFDKCSISIVTNISEDHLGVDDINTLSELARAKSVVPRSTLPEGYAILNADDDLVYQIKENLSCHVALFSQTNTNERVTAHCQQGGLAAYIEEDHIMLQEGAIKKRLAKVIDIPLTFAGRASCMTKNILPAVLAGVISQFALPEMTHALLTFTPSPVNTPGRMNLFDFGRFKVLVDYAHNEDAFIELKNFMHSVKCQKKVGIIAATGDRRMIDIQKVGFYAAQMFDEIIIRHDRDDRGKSHDILTELVKEGIRQVNFQAAVKVIPNEFDAIQYAIDNAIQDTFIMYFPDEILKALEYVKNAERLILQNKYSPDNRVVA